MRELVLKTTKLAIAAMGSQSLPAINAKQFYMTISRCSDNVAIYVDNKEQVRRAIQDSGQQLSATELVTEKPKQNQRVTAKQQLEQRAFIPICISSDSETKKGLTTICRKSLCRSKWG